MAIHANSMTVLDCPQGKTPGPNLTQAIRGHKQAYAASLAARDRISRLHEAFDPDYEFERQADIRAALIAFHGADARTAVAAYFAADTASRAAAAGEDKAWRRFSAIEPQTAPELAEWLAYVQAHAALEDEVVTLRQALQHLAGLLGGRLKTA